MLDLDALADLDTALAELSGDERPRALSPLARSILDAPVSPPASVERQCPHLARMAAE